MKQVSFVLLAGIQYNPHQTVMVYEFGTADTQIHVKLYEPLQTTDNQAKRVHECTLEAYGYTNYALQVLYDLQLIGLDKAREIN